jgi:hypothetical protein
MICAEAVKLDEILWNPRENPSQTKPTQQDEWRNANSSANSAALPLRTQRLKSLDFSVEKILQSEVGCFIRANPRRKRFRNKTLKQKKMRLEPATQAASSVDLPTRLVRHSRGGMMLLARQRSRGSAAFAKAGCTRDLAITAQPLRGPAAHSHS